MTVLLTRVDQRLLHGQVTVAWMDHLRYDAVGIADGELAVDDWEREMVESAAPPGVAVEVRLPADAASWYGDGTSGRRLVLLRSLASLVDLVRAGAPVGEANLGGLHFREGARPFLDFLYLTREDIRAIETLAGLGVRLTAQDVPNRPPVDLNRALSEGRLEYDHLSSRRT